ncbi:RNA polymerase factor sigma-54 [bacterium]|nr:RNA polymerase factor sigma-54 [bacterium]
MPLGMHQVQKLQQRLIMTPQMQQSVKLLQMNTMELEAQTLQELLENPFLEIEEGAGDLEETPRPETDPEAREMVQERESDPDSAAYEADDSYVTAPEKKKETAETSDDPGEISAGEESNEVAGNLESATVEEQPEQFEEVDTNWEEVFEDSYSPVYRAPVNEDEDTRSFEETTALGTSLYEKLEWQLRVSCLSGRDAEVGGYLIGCVNDDGYLQKGAVEECVEKFQVPLEDVEWILEVIQDFEPTGVAARDLPECLCLQLEAMDELDPLTEKAIREHWGLLAQMKFREVARALDVGEAEIEKIFSRIQRLDPTPARSVTKEQTIYITPDVYVKKMDGKYEIYLNEGQVAHLHVNNIYKEILLSDHNGTKQDVKAKEYALDKYRAAVMFIKNIEKRRNTVLRVTEAIMDYQQEFLEKGVEALRPLSLAEIAERVGMHESTISRVTSSKYVDTPQGIYELKFFFSSAIESRHGEAVSSRSIKQKIHELIDSEDSDKPLSDDRIAKALKAQGFTIARRTVAKYREQLRIMPTNLRRRMG